MVNLVVKDFSCKVFLYHEIGLRTIHHHKQVYSLSNIVHHFHAFYRLQIILNNMALMDMLIFQILISFHLFLLLQISSHLITHNVIVLVVELEIFLQIHSYFVFMEHMRK